MARICPTWADLLWPGSEFPPRADERYTGQLCVSDKRSPVGRKTRLRGRANHQFLGPRMILDPLQFIWEKAR